MKNSSKSQMSLDKNQLPKIDNTMQNTILKNNKEEFQSPDKLTVRRKNMNDTQLQEKNIYTLGFV